MRRFPTKLVIAVLAIGGGYGLASLLEAMRAPIALNARDDEPDPAVSPASGAPPASTAVSVEGLPRDGDAFLLRVLNTLERWPNLGAKVKQTVRISDDAVTASGDYWQQGVDNLRRSCWRLQSMLEHMPAMYLQVCTGKYLWTDRRMGELRNVTRIDLQAVARELRNADDQAPPQAGEAQPILLARGGLSQLLAELHRNFTFSSPAPVRLGDKEALAMVGRWRPEKLAEVWPGLETSTATWPAHLPHHVLIKVGRDDLFPYLIQYRRGSQANLCESAAATWPAVDPLANYEFFAVQYAVAMPDPSLFEYTPTNVDVRDLTQRVISRLRPQPAGEAASAARRRVQR